MVEAVTIIVLFFLTPVIVVYVLIGLAQIIDDIGELPIDESEPLALYQRAGNSEQAVLDVGRVRQKARSHSELA
jgi:hypothetical protein